MTCKWFSSTQQTSWREEHSGLLQVPSDVANLTVTSEQFQVIEGFGGCFNELGFVALSHLGEEQRHEVLRSLFHPDGDCKFTVCRLPIGASDYALGWYSLNENDGDVAMDRFTIERDRQYLIPYIKAAQEFQPGLRLFASPWSPPAWMKSPKVYNHGTLRWEQEILDAYALYFAKFVEAYRTEGIRIDQIHVQNEPISDHKFPSCVWTGEQLRDFIALHLGPAFETRHLDTEIWLGTLNGPDVATQLDGRRTISTDYDAYANVVLSDERAFRYIRGVGYQWGGKNALQRTVESYPELKYMQTENECGDGQNSWDYAHYVFNLFRHYLVSGVNAYIYWNMILEPLGRSTWGWTQNALITIDPVAHEITWNPEFYVMKHFSHFVGSGARRIGLRGPWAGNAVAFQNTDGSTVVIVANPMKQERILRLMHESEMHQFTLSPESFNTFVLS